MKDVRGAWRGGEGIGVPKRPNTLFYQLKHIFSMQIIANLVPHVKH